MNEYRLEEYKSLIEDRNHRIREIRKLEILVVGGIAALYAWIYTNKPQTAVIWFLPVLLPIFGFYRALMLKKSIQIIVNYIKTMESHVFEKENEEIVGYETYRSTIPKSGVTVSSFIFWISMIIVTTIFSVLMQLGAA